MFNRLAAARAKRCQGSIWLSQVPSLCEVEFLNLEPILQIASGDTLNDYLPDDFRQWLDIKARIVLAQVLAKHFKTRNPNVTDDQIEAKVWAELGASWAVDGVCDMPRMQSSRNQLVGIVREVGFDVQSLTIMAHNLWMQLQQAQTGGTVPREKALPFVDVPAGINNVAYQKFRFYEVSGHAFDWTKVFDLNEQHRAIIQGLKTVDANIVDINANQPEALPQINWLNLTEDELLALAELAYGTNTQNYTVLNVAAAVGIIFSLCKGETLTDAWLASRLQRIVTQAPTMNLQDKVTIARIKAFSNLFGKRKITTDKIYSYLMVAYNSFQQTELGSITWVIEQAIAHNYAHATSFGSVNVDLKYRCLPFLMSEIDNQQWTTLAQLACDLYYDPWHGILEAKVPARTYIDLANFGKVGYTKLNQAFRGYQGGFIPGGSLTKQQIEGLIDIVRERITEDMEMGQTNDRLLSLIYHGLVFETVGNFTYITNPSGGDVDFQRAAIGANAERNAGAGGVQEGHGGNQVPGDQNVDGVIRGREDWAQRMQRLPPSAKRLPASQLDGLWKQGFANNERLRAGKTICDYLNNIGTQIKLEPFGDDQTRTNLVTRFRKIPDDLRDAAVRLGAEPQPNPTPTAGTHDDMTINQLTKPPRRIIAERDQGGNRGPQGGEAPPPPQALLNVPPQIVAGPNNDEREGAGGGN